ncbi:hypothetical protein ACJ51O_36995 (plasmid) [Burkholderia pyrrocinia]|uniref:hypothetical protein n=1 Tax=Burkholderia pyrrocinia TaxID=60550 RepID=UPI0038B5D3DA
MPTAFNAVARGQMLKAPHVRADFPTQYGNDKAQCHQAYSSTRVHVDVRHPTQLVRDDRVNGMPIEIVGCRYEARQGYTENL